MFIGWENCVGILYCVKFTKLEMILGVIFCRYADENRLFEFCLIQIK